MLTRVSVSEIATAGCRDLYSSMQRLVIGQKLDHPGLLKPAERHCRWAAYFICSVKKTYSHCQSLSCDIAERQYLSVTFTGEIRVMLGVRLCRRVVVRARHYDWWSWKCCSAAAADERHHRGQCMFSGWCWRRPDGVAPCWWSVVWQSVESIRWCEARGIDGDSATELEQRVLQPFVAARCVALVSRNIHVQLLTTKLPQKETNGGQ